MITVKEIESYLDYGKCVSISNGITEALVTIDLGPRIISYGYIGGQNFMCDERDRLGVKCSKEYTDFFGEGRKWENLGGHRIWLSPESYPETYLPDDRSVRYEITDCGAVFMPYEDTQVGVAKTLEIKMNPENAEMRVIMGVKNITDKPLEFAIWALSVCTEGGTLIVPMNTDDTGLLPNRVISVWPYTDMSDNRIYWGKKYVTVRQDSTSEEPMKLGFDLKCGTAYYALNGEVLRKRYSTNHPDGAYPDGGCSFETYTNDCMLEFETLGELKRVMPGDMSEHSEVWTLCKQPCEVDFKSDASIDEMLSKI